MNLYGKNPVLERINTAPDTIKKLYLQKKTDLSEIVRSIKKNGLKFESVDKKWFDTNFRGIHSQGVVAEVEDFKYVPFSLVAEKCLKKDIIPVFLDRVTDIQNLGSIIRTLACMGGFSLVLPEHESASITETVLRVASGGENYVLIAKVMNIVKALKELKDKGVTILGADVDGENDIFPHTPVSPIAVVMGSEGEGIRPGIKKVLDREFRIPMRGASLSFNVSVATAIFCYEIARCKVNSR